MPEQKEKSDFIAMHEMCEKNLDISCHLETLNFQRTRRGGLVQVGVACPAFDHLINQAATGNNTHYWMFYVVNKKQFDEIKNAADPMDAIKAKAAKWDALAEKMAQFYAENSDADLGVIGEEAAMAFGYL